MRRVKPGIVLLAMALLFVGCATLQNQKATAYKSLAGMALTYETAMKTLAQLDRDGLLKPEEKVKAVQAATVFWTAWHEAAISLQIWMSVDTPEAQDKVKAVLENVLAKYEDMMRYLQPLLQRAQR
jgi:hypothetical protein